TLAVQYGEGLTPQETVQNAETFLAFLNRGDDVIAKPAAKPVKAAKPIASKPAPEPEPEVEADEAPTVTDKEVGEALGAMLAADKREEAVALMGKFGAKSTSTLDKKFYAAFVAQANEIVLTA